MFFFPPSDTSPRCYAHLLGSCSTGLSREHLFTKGVMGQGGAIGLRGHPSIPDDTFVGLSSATAKVLCSAHNSRLAVLDDEAVKLSRALDKFHSANAGASEVEIDGRLFERWLLKVSLGYFAAGHTSLGRRYPSTPEIVAALFGQISMSAPVGMYSMVGVHRHAEHTKEVLFRELVAIDPNGIQRAVGSFVALHGLPFLFSLGGPFPIEDYLRKPDGASYLDPYDCTLARASFHPPFVRLSEDIGKEILIRFRWD